MRFQSLEDEFFLSFDENKKVFEVVEVEKGYRFVDLKSFFFVFLILYKCEEGEKNIIYYKYVFQFFEFKEK